MRDRNIGSPHIACGYLFGFDIAFAHGHEKTPFRKSVVRHGDKMFAAVCDLGLEGIVSKKLTAPYRSGPTRNWIKVKNPNAPAATRVLEGGF